MQVSTRIHLSGLQKKGGSMAFHCLLSASGHLMLARRFWVSVITLLHCGWQMNRTNPQLNRWCRIVWLVSRTFFLFPHDSFLSN